MTFVKCFFIHFQKSKQSETTKHTHISALLVDLVPHCCAHKFLRLINIFKTRCSALIPITAIISSTSVAWAEVHFVSAFILTLSAATLQTSFFTSGFKPQIFRISCLATVVYFLKSNELFIAESYFITGFRTVHFKSIRFLIIACFFANDWKSHFHFPRLNRKR